jgi:predicted porin
MRQSSDFVPAANGQPDPRVSDESGLVAGVRHTHEVSPTTRLSTLAEWASLSDRGGIDGHSAKLLTLGEALQTGDWTLQASYSRRSSYGPDTSASLDRLLALTAGYTLTRGISLEAGWRRLQVADATEHEAAVTLRFQNPH